jgi:hypothetical protein
MERGSSVGEQFFTIDNTVKENLNNQNNRGLISHNDYSIQKQPVLQQHHAYMPIKPQQTLVPQAP